MIWLLFSLILFICLCASAIAYILIKLIEVTKQNAQAQSNMNKLSKVINSVRYGNLNERAEETFSLGENLNRLIETLVDREAMLNEYQCEMHKKIEAEKDNKILMQDFIATLTHDLKVPIIAQDNTFDLFLQERFGKLNEKSKEAIINLKNSNEEVKSLVQALLDTYKIEEGGFSVNKTTVNAADFLEEALGEMLPITQRQNHDLNLHIINTDKIKLDEFLIKRAIKNLIFNASVYSFQDSAIDIYLSLKDNICYISIINYGVGIDQKEIDAIFEKFYSGAKKFRKIGTGLGLYITNKIVKLHSGKIVIESIPNIKTEFRLELPI